MEDIPPAKYFIHQLIFTSANRKKSSLGYHPHPNLPPSRGKGQVTRISPLLVVLRDSQARLPP